MKFETYLEFLRYCLSDCLLLPVSVRQINWMDMMKWSEMQAIVGIVYSGIEKADKAINVPFDALMEWIGYAQQIEMRNKLLNNKCVAVVEELKHDGYDSFILKGQGNSAMYPYPSKRTSGDIDVLIKNADRKILTQYVNSRHKVGDIHYEHMEYDDEGIQVEIHFMPGIMNNPIYNLRLQRWYQSHSESQMADLSDGVGQIPVPTREFNVVFQLAHMMHHYFDEGIGLRQFVDYYYLLRSIDKGKLIIDDLTGTLRHLNLYNFARAVMYIEKEVLGLEEQYLIVEPDEKRGKTLLREILEGGNFGRSSNLDQHSAAKKYFQKTWRNLRLAREYPAEALCEPFFRTWHFFWRLAH